MAVQVETHDIFKGTTVTGTLLATGFWITIVWAIAIGRFDPLGLTLVFAVFHWWHKGRAEAKGKKSESSREAFERFVCGPVDYCDWARESGHEHCIALSLQRKSFFIFQNGLMARLPFEDIRSVDVYYMDLIGGSFADKWAKSGEQVRYSGIFFKTRSLDHPELKFRSAKKPLIEKWSEIWAQLQEGVLPPTAGVSVGKIT